MTSANSVLSNSSALRPWARSMTTFSRTSLVLIISTLMPAVARH